MTRRGLLIAFGVALAAIASPVFACVPADGYPRQVELVPEVVAEAMVRAATFVDVAVVEDLTPDFEVGTRNVDEWSWYAKQDPSRPTLAEMLARGREEWPDGVRIHYRVVEHLKGDGPASFAFNGTKPPQFIGDPGPPPLDALKYFLRPFDLATASVIENCGRPVQARLGETHLVFRDADGDLLQASVPARLLGRDIEPLGPAVVPITPTDSAWLRIVRAAIANAAPAP